MEYNHIPVLYDEVIKGLNIKKDGIYLDGTLGGGGHALGILERLDKGRLIACDKDQDAIDNALERLKEHKDKLTLIKDDYKNIIARLRELNIEYLDGVILDLGISSYQIDTPNRGFSYIYDAPLDMRMDREQALSAYDVINDYDEKKLADILYQYGEERLSRKIAKAIMERRRQNPIRTTKELADIVAMCYPPKERYKYGNPAKRTFQAVRIEVNGELEGLKEFIYDIALYLRKGGRMCVITFHSLEDRIVKHCFKELEKDCICDKRLPVCGCDKRKEIEILTKKPILGKKQDIANKRAESAKLRIIERV
ncbi:MAG: 16S rRNA (cytosine(1402)-N(4))-methyltransferase RsmH [Bacillota bacterium]|jgi:16S rRNA (cytosine1402-N4)-methyltransferase|nr:16S rRNA (cytosine(1402)-N(4))-methyltransferase RsmH [Bacillota bacterium]HHU43161.1 16S rRNA (cytosine(1402)-N(4))-methyltransferase RsmH [Clostridiales bacterium]